MLCAKFTVSEWPSPHTQISFITESAGPVIIDMSVKVMAPLVQLVLLTAKLAPHCAVEKSGKQKIIPAENNKGSNFFITEKYNIFFTG